MKAQTASTLAAVEPDAWDALAPGALYSSHAWLSFLEHDGDADVGYVIVEDRGRLLAAMPFAHVRREGNALYDWSGLLRARGLVPSDGERLIAGPRRGYQTQLLTASDADEQRTLEAVTLLLDELDAEVRERSLAGALALYADTATARLIRAARPDATVAHIAHDAWIELPGTRVSDHLDGLGAHRRARVRREMAAFAAAGYRCEHATLEAAAGEAGPLLARTQERHGHPADPDSLTRSLRAQGRAMGDAAEVLLLRHGGPALGFVSFYCRHDTVFLRAAGFDHERLLGAAEYFNLAYHLPMALAYARGLRRMHAGIEATEAKALRGARTRPLWLVDLDDAVEPGPAARHNATVADGLRGGPPAVVRAVDAGAWDPFATVAEVRGPART